MTSELLQAGALIPIDGGELGDPVSAREYRHPALGDRVVVELVADNLAPAEDLALEYLGFSLQGAQGPVARRRRQALGFPAWALINDPKNGAYALGLVKEMERVARVAKSKPGNAKDLYETMAAKLARSVPHFLPTFHEQAGRTFIEAGNNAQAATMFGKAREAERIYNLEVDEDRRRDVFLEFALAGAISAGALEDYSSELVRSHGPERGYELFRELCLQRCRGGLPPWAAMADELHKLAAAAGRDRSTEDEDILAQLLELPATAGAAFGFWKAYRKPLVALGKRSAQARGRLLDLHPWPPREAQSFHDWWFKALDEAGALEALTGAAGSVPKESEPTGGAAAWLSKTCATQNKHLWGRGSVDGLMSLLARMAPRLRADGEPVDINGNALFATSLDLLDLALELEVPLAPPPGGFLSIDRWLAGKRTRPLTHLAGDSVYGPRLMGSLDGHLRRNHADSLIATPGMAAMVARWLDSCADKFETGALLQMEQELKLVGQFTSPRTFALNPSARQRIAASSAAPALARTLRGGLLDEFGWPALELARRKLNPGQYGVALAQSWPYLIVSDGVKAFVVGRDGIVLEHDVRINDRYWGLPFFFYTGGQLLVMWRGSDGQKAYWSGRPGDVFKPQRFPQEQQPGSVGISWEMEDGGRTVGSRSIHAGDTSFPETSPMATDGKTFWRQTGSAGKPTIQEYDPASGRGGDQTRPSFFQEYAADGHEFLVARSWLLPSPDDGPLGPAGLIGIRVRRKADGRSIDAQTADGRSIDAQTPDGRSFTGVLSPRMQLPMPAGPVDAPTALVSFPGDGASRPLAQSWRQLTLFDPTGELVLFSGVPGAVNLPSAAATSMLPPILFWQHFRVRDEAGSTALRQVSEAIARELTESAMKESSDEMPSTASLLRKLLPQVTSPELQRGVLGAVRMAALIESGLRSLSAVQQTTPPSPPPSQSNVDAVTDGQLSYALSGLVSGGADGNVQTAGAFAQVRTVSEYIASALEGGPQRPGILGAFRPRDAAVMPKSLPDTQVRWQSLAGRMAALLFRASSPATTAEQRAALIAFIELWAGTPFAKHSEWFRVCTATQEGTGFTQGAWLSTREDRHYFYSYDRFDQATKKRRAVILEGSRSGFKTLPGHVLETERGCAANWETSDRLLSFVALLRKRGPIPWRPEQVERLSALTGMSNAEAALLLAGAPNLDRYQQNFLEREQREAIGLKATDAATGRQQLQKMADEWLVYILAAALPERAEDLWERNDPLADRVAAAWLSGNRRRVAVPDELIAAAEVEASHRFGGASAVAMFAEPRSSLQLAPEGFDPAALLTAARLLAWLFINTPVGDQVRQGIPEVVALARERLRNPTFVISGGYRAAEVQGRPLKELLPPGDGPFELEPAYGGRMMIGRLRPAAITGREDPRIASMLGLQSFYAATRLLAGPAGEAFASRVTTTPVPAGAFEANPASSAAETVAEVTRELDISTDAATLYLQLLALAEPTVKNVLRWNGWAGKQYQAASEELLARKLAVSGKRARAAREIFLPGPWNQLKAPNLPVEAWKMDLYENAPLAGRMLPLQPIHELFARAWLRASSGDAPKFEEVSPSQTR